MGANIYPEDVETVIYSHEFLAKNINSFALSLLEDSNGNPRPCFEFELPRVLFEDQPRAIEISWVDFYRR